MKKENGFTLVELLGVITIIGILAIITIPKVTQYVGKAKNTYYDQTIKNIETATNEYLMDYTDKIPDTEGGYTEILLKTLMDEKYIGTIQNNETKETCNENSVIRVTSGASKGANNNLKIDVCLKCGSMSSPASSCKSENVISFADSNLQPIKEYNLLPGTTYYPTVVKLGTPNEKIKITNLKSYNQGIVSQKDDTIKGVKGGTAVLEATAVLDGNTYITSLIVNVTDTVKPIDKIYVTKNKVTTDFSKSNLEANDVEYSDSAFTAYKTRAHSSYRVYAYSYPSDDDRDIECSIIDNKGYGTVTVKKEGTGRSQSCVVYTGAKVISYDPSKPEENIYLYIKTKYASDEASARKIPLDIDLGIPSITITGDGHTMRTASKWVYPRIHSGEGYYPLETSDIDCWGRGITCTKSGTSYNLKRTASKENSCYAYVSAKISYNNGTEIVPVEARYDVTCECYCKKTKYGVKWWRACSECY